VREPSRNGHAPGAAVPATRPPDLAGAPPPGALVWLGLGSPLLTLGLALSLPVAPDESEPAREQAPPPDGEAEAQP